MSRSRHPVQSYAVLRSAQSILSGDDPSEDGLCSGGKERLLNSSGDV